MLFNLLESNILLVILICPTSSADAVTKTKWLQIAFPALVSRSHFCTLAAVRRSLPFACYSIFMPQKSSLLGFSPLLTPPVAAQQPLPRSFASRLHIKRNCQLFGICFFIFRLAGAMELGPLPSPFQFALTFKPR